MSAASQDPPAGVGDDRLINSERAMLDAAGGVPLNVAGREALLAALDLGWADPARLGHESRRAAGLLDAARESVAAVLGAAPPEVSFTASGSEANWLAVSGLTAPQLRRSRTSLPVVVSAVEHSSVLSAAEEAVGAGGVFRVGVDSLGRVDVGAFGVALSDGGPAALAVLQSANHEVGTRQPVDDVHALAAAAGIPLLVDAAASVGREAVPRGWSALTASAHKWGGPGGVGVIAVRTGVRWRAPWPGRERERGRALGPPPVPAIVAAAAALEAVERDRAIESARLALLVDRIRVAVPQLVPDVEVVGDPVGRLPHIVTFSCLYVDGEALLTALDRAGFVVSSGSSCTADTLEPSHVLVAMGALSHGNVRVSLPMGCPAADIERFLSVLPGAVAGVRAALGASDL